VTYFTGFKSKKEREREKREVCSISRNEEKKGSNK